MTQWWYRSLAGREN